MKLTNRVFIVEDHPLMQEGFTALLERAQDLAPCGAAGNAAEALDRIPEAEPDLVLVDISLHGEQNGIDFIEQLQAVAPGLPTLIVSAHDELLYAERALRAGARGYLMKSEPSEVLLEAIRVVLRGEVFLSEQVRARIVLQHLNFGSQEEEPVERLSDRELKVFERLGRGRTTQQIADELDISPKTVETYRAHLKNKLQVSSSTELLRRAILWVETASPA